VHDGDRLADKGLVEVIVLEPLAIVVGAIIAHRLPDQIGRILERPPSWRWLPTPLRQEVLLHDPLQLLPVMFADITAPDLGANLVAMGAQHFVFWIEQPELVVIER
jgi:hypothetical protein